MRRGVGDCDGIGRSKIIKDLINDRARDEDVSDRVCGGQLVAADGMLLEILGQGGGRRREDKDAGQRSDENGSHAKKQRQVSIECTTNHAVCISQETIGPLGEEKAVCKAADEDEELSPASVAPCLCFGSLRARDPHVMGELEFGARASFSSSESAVGGALRQPIVPGHAVSGVDRGASPNKQDSRMCLNNASTLNEDLILRYFISLSIAFG